jgi:hypothetical protein
MSDITDLLPSECPACSSMTFSYDWEEVRTIGHNEGVTIKTSLCGVKCTDYSCDYCEGVPVGQMTIKSDICDEKVQVPYSNLHWDFRHTIGIVPWLMVRLEQVTNAEGEDRDSLRKIVLTSLPNYWEWYDDCCDRYGFWNGGRHNE